MKNKYLFLYPDVFLWYNENKGVLYNSSTFDLYIFNIKSPIDDCCKELEDNLYVTKLSSETLEASHMKEWLENILKKNMGNLEEVSDSNFPLISFPPILNLQCEVDRLKTDKLRNVGEIALQNWNECFIYLGGESVTNTFYKQIPYPIDSQEEIVANDLLSFLKTADNSNLGRINIIGNIFTYYDNERLLSFLNNLSAKKYFYLKDDYCFSSDIAKIFSDNSHCIIYHTSYERTCVAINQFNKLSIPFQIACLIASNDDYEYVMKLQEKIQNDIIFFPVYTGDNLSFFKNYVYIQEEDFNHLKYNKKDIFAHQVLNSNYWGRLFILPSGKVYSNLNVTPIGTLNDLIPNLIIKEMENRTAWRLTRDDISICKKCLFKYLCPSVSNYEYVIGSFDLCYMNVSINEYV